MPNNLALRMRPKNIDQVIGQLLVLSQEQPSTPFGPSMPQPTVKSACKKSLKKPNFLVVWFYSLMKFIVSIKPNKTFSYPYLKMEISS